MFYKKATKIDKSSPSIWQYVVSVKSTVKISSIFVAFLENTNFKHWSGFWTTICLHCLCWLPWLVCSFDNFFLLHWSTTNYWFCHIITHNTRVHTLTELCLTLGGIGGIELPWIFLGLLRLSTCMILLEVNKDLGDFRVTQFFSSSKSA